MKCFVHRDRDAVGSCKSCQKGICPDCAVDMGHAITCKGECERSAAAVEKLVRRNIGLSSAQQRLRFLYPGFIILFGLVMAGWGVSFEGGLNFLVYAGVLMIAYGLLVLRATLRWSRDNKTAGV